jgi:YVTN family beta-propeller protein
MNHERWFVRIDPATNRATRVQTGRDGPSSFTVAGDTMWVSNRNDGTVSEIDPATNRETALVQVGAGPVIGALGADGGLWIPNGGEDTLSRIDPRRAAVTDTVTVDRAPIMVLARGGDLWVTCHGGRVWRLRVA